MLLCSMCKRFAFTHRIIITYQSLPYIYAFLTLGQVAHSFGITSSVCRHNSNSLNMKIFDWKARESFAKLEIPAGTFAFYY